MVVTRDKQSPSTLIAGHEMNNFYYANVVKENREFALFFLHQVLRGGLFACENDSNA